jgi:hypothetical protein
MKIFARILLILLAIIPMIAFAQDQRLHGTWKVDAEKTFNPSNNRDQSKYDNMSLEAKEKMKNSFKDQTFDFGNPDNITIVYALKKNTPTSIKGTWAYHADDNKLTISVNGSTKQYHVEWETKNAIRLVNSDGNGMLKSLYLKRQ